jgi:hypothetical protein
MTKHYIIFALAMTVVSFAVIEAALSLFSSHRGAIELGTFSTNKPP